jgi:hypothetical protein
MSIVDLGDARWFKNSFSGDGQNSDCVEVAWVKSNYSTGGQGSDCVKVALVCPAIAVRDSKNPADGVLGVPVTSWRAFLASCR